ncbi:Predicted HKD family nuclease [Enterobacter hormaechei]|nr:Predicted HKD family nuclease [Enterobacter hormaechei]CZX92305.1 Predicted HKD family nuclease [Enterobacter hormaechei]SAD72295.1 Predicted HKD family nuclease [Enterobacter hormaechei]SAE17307.1 Predicted HKD family nuclease [Enterobacter hormaechei]STP62879.1 Predicted HKD family nuclease [Enterobacter hormaechei]
MAAEVARKMLELKLVDLILCFAPSSVVVASIESTFSHILQRNFNGGLGAVGAAYTYHSLMYFDKSFWKSLQMHRVLVIFDEIHHCSGDSLDNANVWGGEILSQVQQCASYSLALTGTPWRTDSTPIVLSNYTDPDGEICCDYVYGLHEAIVDGVCRKPKIALINSNNLVYSSKDNVQFFGSITDFLSETVASYQSIIWHPEAMKYVLEAGCKKLNEIRKVNSDAGGLVVASSVEHAYKLLNILEKEFDQTAIIVTYHDRDALAKIGYYRQSTTEWIVSVGMISEGTDIPRLQVCCHLSSVKTELYFRQVLGRILRVNQSENQEAWLFTMATNELTLFSNRLAEDLPEDYKVMQQQSDDWSFPTIDSQSMPPEFMRKNGISKIKEIDLEMDIGEITKSSPTISSQTKQLKMGSMHQQVIDAFLFSII